MLLKRRFADRLQPLSWAQGARADAAGADQSKAFHYAAAAHQRARYRTLKRVCSWRCILRVREVANPDAFKTPSGAQHNASLRPRASLLYQDPFQPSGGRLSPLTHRSWKAQIRPPLTFLGPASGLTISRTARPITRLRCPVELPSRGLAAPAPGIHVELQTRRC